MRECSWLWEYLPAWQQVQTYPSSMTASLEGRPDAPLEHKDRQGCFDRPCSNWTHSLGVYERMCPLLLCVHISWDPHSNLKITTSHNKDQAPKDESRALAHKQAFWSPTSDIHTSVWWVIAKQAHHQGSSYSLEPAVPGSWHRVGSERWLSEGPIYIFRRHIACAIGAKD